MDRKVRNWLETITAKGHYHSINSESSWGTYERGLVIIDVTMACGLSF